jgi:hypothetical protein
LDANSTAIQFEYKMTRILQISCSTVYKIWSCYNVYDFLAVHLLFQVTVFLGSTVVAKIGYFRIIKFNFILQVVVAATMYFLGRTHTWMLALYFLIET